MTAPYVRTPDDARRRPTVGGVSTLAMYGLTLTVVSRRVWTWTPSAVAP